MSHMILPLLLALLGGAGGFLLRRWELSAVFEESGLAVLWSIPSLILIALSAVLAAAFVLLCRKAEHKPTDFSEAFCVQNNWLYLILMALSAAAMLFAGILGLRSNDYSGVLRRLMNIMCLMSFLCIPAVAWINFQGRPLRYSLPLLVPGYTLCLWLVAAYQRRAADPVVLDYVYELLAIICTLIGLYFCAGFSFGRPKIRRCAVFSLLGIYFSIVTLADAHSVIEQLLFLFCILYQLAFVSALLYHIFVAYTPTQPTESNNTQEVTPDE